MIHTIIFVFILCYTYKYMSTYQYNIKPTYLLTGLLFSQLHGDFTRMKLQAQCLKLSVFLSINCNTVLINIGCGI